MKEVWNFLASAKLAIFLFFLLAGFSILGTIIPQGQPEEFYLMKYGSGLGKLILFFQINDAYHSWWYVTALFLFLTNLIVCSLRRFPFSYKLYKKAPWEVNPEILPNKVTFECNGDLNKIKNFLTTKLKFLPSPQSLADGFLFYKSENRFSFFSVYVVHLSLIIIVIGALIGALFGWRGSLNILEGEESNIVQPLRKKNPIQLDFSVKLNQFILETYPNGMPKEYISNVTIIDKDFNKTAIIKVNQPLKYKDIVFYQASYNIIPEFNVFININGDKETYVLSPLSPVNVKDRYSIVLRDYGEAHGFIYLKVWIFNEETSESKEGLIISGFPPLEVGFGKDKLTLEYKDIAKLIYMTGLQAKKDPANWIVYLGFILMMLGLILVYYWDPKTYWIFLKPSNEKITIHIGAYSKREREILKVKIRELGEEVLKIT
ncbi:MAG: cytochrome c biogenesis protein ResB [Caldimicrobium sp.]